MKLQFIVECLTWLTSSRAGGALQGGALQLWTHLPEVLHGDASCAGAVGRQEAASDGGPGGANCLVDPQHDVHAVFTQDAMDHLNRTMQRKHKQ